MPHDAKGTKLEVGDEVIINAKVTAITSDGEEACNVTVDVVADNEEYKPTIAMNAKNVVKKETD